MKTRREVAALRKSCILAEGRSVGRKPEAGEGQDRKTLTPSYRTSSLQVPQARFILENPAARELAKQEASYGTVFSVSSVEKGLQPYHTSTNEASCSAMSSPDTEPSYATDIRRPGRLYEWNESEKDDDQSLAKEYSQQKKRRDRHRRSPSLPMDSYSQWNREHQGGILGVRPASVQGENDEQVSDLSTPEPPMKFHSEFHEDTTPMYTESVLYWVYHVCHRINHIVGLSCCHSIRRL